MVKKNGQDYFSDDARKVIVDKLILPTLKKEWHDLLKGDCESSFPARPMDRQG